MRGKNRLPKWLSLSTVLILVAIIVAAALIVGGMTLWRAHHDEATGVEKGMGAVVTFFQTGFSKLGDAVVHLFRGPYWDAQTVEEYLSLKQEVASLRAQNEQMTQIQSENERLTALLDVQQDYAQNDPICARVINRDQTAYTSMLVIDKGENDGVAADMAVVTAEGLVGRVTQTGASWARVTCIISNDSGVPAMVETTRDPGVIRGNLAQGDGAQLLTMQYLPTDAVVTPGDLVVTSGMGGVYPKGILIGEVTSVQRGQSQTASVIVMPAADFVHLEEVMVISSQTTADAQEGVAQ